MAIIKTRNLLHEDAGKTRLTNTEVSGTTTLRVENTTGLTNGWGVQIGEVGEEQTEVAIGTAATGTTITLPATSYDHPADTPVYFIKFNQVVFKRSTDGTAGTASAMTDGTVTYQADDKFTIFDDTSGSSTYAYRTQFRNSALSVTSTESDWITFAGPDFYSLAKIRSRVKNKLWNADWLTDDIVDEWVNEWKDELNTEVINVNEDYALGTQEVALASDGLGTITTADFNQVRRVWVTFDGSNQYQSTKMNINDFLPDEQFSSTHPYHYFQGGSIIGVRPADTGTASLAFYRFGTPMVNDTDTLPHEMRPYTKSFVDYGVAMAAYKDEKEGMGDRKLAAAERSKQEFVGKIVPRDKSGPTSINLVEPISGTDDGMPI